MTTTLSLPADWRLRVRRTGSALLGRPAFKATFPFLVVIGAWWLVDYAALFPKAFFVGPGAVIETFTRMLWKGYLPEYLADSLTRLFTGSAIAIAVGIPLGYIIGLNRYIRRACWPVIMFFQAIADIAWLPLLVIWFGFSLTSVNLVLFYSIVFPLVLSIIAGIDSQREDLLRAARSLGANRRQIFLEVILPGSFAFVATGIRVGLGYGWRALIATEIIVGSSGIGFMMFEARREGDIALVLVGMTILATLWYATDALILSPLERATVERWGLVRRTGTA
jgi:NitT/TauT family transport system permease protein/taurine transport system permease protein